jgi:DNA modification methylase
MTKLSDLQPDANNANRGTAKGQKAIVGSIQRSKLGRSIVVDRNNKIIGGNKTTEAVAEVLGVDAELIVVESAGDKLLVHKRTDLDLDDPDPNNPARQLAYSDNLTSAFSFELDPIVTLADIDAGFSFDDIGVTLPDLSSLGVDVGANGKEPGPPPVDKAAELREKWSTSLGQVWSLDSGKGYGHRVICGDCTDRAVVDKVMGGDRADMLNTDPVYGVDYSGQTSTMFYGKDKAGKPTKRLRNDTSIEEASPLISTALSLLPAPVAFVWHAPQFHDIAKRAIEQAGYKLFSVIVWNKNHANFGAMGARYKPKFEMALACKVDSIPWYGPDNEVTVWDIDRQQKNIYHPTEKPVPLFERAIKNHTTEGNLIVDPFLGSGTTLIACENLGRKCRAVEIDPGYVAVTLERYHTHTGIEPELIETG